MTLEEQNVTEMTDCELTETAEHTDEPVDETETAATEETTVAPSEDTVEVSEIEPPAEDKSEVLTLRAELEALKKELEESRAFYARLDVECAEFSSLYPGVSITSLPDSVWQSVKKGVPLSAAYALEVRRAEMKAQKARAINRENRERSSGAIGIDNRNDFFSPTQVRAMSAAEVRANYTKIIESMSKWH